MDLATSKSIVSNAFKSQNWNFSADDSNQDKVIFSINFLVDGKSHTKCKIIVFNDGICDIEVYFPFSCPTKKIEELALCITKLNYSKRYATFRLDPRDGEIQFSYSYIFNDSTTSTSFLQRFINCKNIDDEEYSQIESICLSKDPTHIESSKEPIDSEPPITSSPEPTKKNKHKISL